MIKSDDLREHIVKPVLEALSAVDERLYSDHAVELLMGTAAQESLLGFYLAQMGGGPGLGIYSIESATHHDVLRYLNRHDKADLKAVIERFTNHMDDAALVGNLHYATAIARIKYWMIPDPMPETLEGYADYWKVWYNTSEGDGTVAKYIQNYENLVL